MLLSPYSGSLGKPHTGRLDNPSQTGDCPGPQPKKMTIQQAVHKRSDDERTDWFAWLRTETGVYIQVQIGYMNAAGKFTTKEEAEIIVNGMTK